MHLQFNVNTRLLTIMKKISVFSPNKLLLASCIGLLPLTAFGQEQIKSQANTEQSHSNYSATFFSQYQPQNAFDMIERLPGFSFDGGDNARGFGGNAGNVLIDGARPTSKSGGLRGALQRIPAEQVERIVIIRGGVSAGDAAGQSVVANVIKRKDVTSGTYAIKFRRAPHGDLKPNVEAAVNTNIGEWESVFDIDIGYGPGFRHAEINNYDKVNALISSIYEERDSLGRFMFTNGQVARDFDAGKLTLNGRLGNDKWTNDQFRNKYDKRLADKTAPDSVWTLDEINRFQTGEFSIDWVQKFNDWKWHSLALGKFESRKYKNNIHNTAGEGSTSQYARDRYESEYIVRSTYAFIGDNKFKPEFGIELARNYLDNKELDSRRTKLDNGVVQVVENRGEVFTSFVYAYDDQLSIDGGITAEFSQIEVIGGNENKQDFNFVKPRLAANYKINNDMNFIVEAQHIVGQLNLRDFANGKSIEDDRDVSGNSHLKPDQTTKLSTTFDWGYSEKGSVKITTYYEWRTDVLEESILSNGSFGKANAGDAKTWGVDLLLNIPTDGIIDNGLLEIMYDWTNSSFKDHSNNHHRELSGHVPRDLKVKFRQDIIESKFAWGVNYFGNFEDTAYRVNERVKFEGNDRAQVFVETTYFDGFKIQLEINQANVGKFTRTRYKYNGIRVEDNYNGYEISKRRREPEYKLSIWGTF